MPRPRKLLIIIIYKRAAKRARTFYPAVAVDEENCVGVVEFLITRK